MTYEEKLTMVSAMSGETDNDVISAYLTIAGQKICRIAYPFEDVTEVPSKYDSVHVEATVYLLNKRGAEGETYHNENGINRTYEDADLPVSMLRGVVPCVGVPK